MFVRNQNTFVNARIYSDFEGAPKCLAQDLKGNLPAFASAAMRNINAPIPAKPILVSPGQLKINTCAIDGHSTVTGEEVGTIGGVLGGAAATGATLGAMTPLGPVGAVIGGVLGAFVGAIMVGAMAERNERNGGPWHV